MPAPKLTTYFKSFKTDPLGQIFLSGIVNVATLDRVSLEIIQLPHAPVNKKVNCSMGKITVQTLAQSVAQFALGTCGVRKLVGCWDLPGLQRERICAPHTG